MKTAVKSIRAYCIECGDGTYKEVRLCQIIDCPLYLYRFGRRPTEAEKVNVHRLLVQRGLTADPPPSAGQSAGSGHGVLHITCAVLGRHTLKARCVPPSGR